MTGYTIDEAGKYIQCFARNKIFALVQGTGSMTLTVQYKRTVDSDTDADNFISLPTSITAEGIYSVELPSEGCDVRLICSTGNYTSGSFVVGFDE
jgi:hypothetical protein